MQSLSVQELEVRSNGIVVIQKGIGSLCTGGFESSECFLLDHSARLGRTVR
jgi:hypothetical protein